MRRVRIDVTPLRQHRDYRILWLGQLISEAGRQITLAAVFFQVFELTGSSAAVGLIGIFQLVPLLVSSIAGQTILDALDRRRILIFTQLGYVVASSMLLFSALQPKPPLALIYAAVALAGALGGLDGPTRSAITPNLVPRHQLPTALSLNQLMWNTTMSVGPIIGGFLIANYGIAWAYAIDVVTYIASITAAAMIRPMPPIDRTESSVGFKAIAEGFSYLRGRRLLQSTFAIDLIAMIFGMPRALFPVLAQTQFKAGPQVFGFLIAAPSVGAILASLTSGWVSAVHRQGQALIVAVLVWGVGITAFGLSGRLLPLALLFLVIAGAADVISAVFRSTILQLSVPDHLRGRLSAIHILVVVGGPRLGDFEAGLVGAWLTPSISVISGGVLTIAGVLLLAAGVPELRSYVEGSLNAAASGQKLDDQDDERDHEKKMNEAASDFREEPDQPYKQHDT
jgi:MFS family permease